MKPTPFNFNSDHFETLIYSAYYAPRGRQRLYMLAGELSNRYIYPNDLLIGIIGAEGSGKSTLIKGLFPGLELTNDDEGVNLRPTPIYEFQADNYFAGHTFHLDARYELAFKQKWEIVEAVKKVVASGRRVVVEHFDLLYAAPGTNASILFGIGEEVLVARPDVFGPEPDKIKSVVNKTIRFRKMAHTAEDLINYILVSDYDYQQQVYHSDVKHGFIIKFVEKPEINIEELEAKAKQVIAKDCPVTIVQENKIAIGDYQIYCSGTRTHVKSTGEIENFSLLKNFVYDPLKKVYMLVGVVGRPETAGYEDLSYIRKKYEPEGQKRDE
ncbi:MAG: alanine-tRNA synthetase second additional domain-containing protein [Deltaproteobacteria bacterium]|jgi:tRNA A37 threonylcarbamoyladenosine biosynthesis protein TsaE|nr:alanine-tRNA synthetase second additional domain-containing protein [Deltaproteobacteria bacterium]